MSWSDASKCIASSVGNATPQKKLVPIEVFVDLHQPALRAVISPAVEGAVNRQINGGPPGMVADGT
jgi:hypothetical protein